MSAVTLILLLAISSSLFIFAPTVKAETYAAHAYASVSPDPAGINQQVTILMWLIELNPVAAGQSGHWQNYTLLITDPDGKTQSFGPFTADVAGYAYSLYTPEKIGTYTLKFTFSGQHVTGIGTLIPIPVDNYYEASSYTTTFTVQQEQATITPLSPLPTGYWERPINAQNQEWYTISGNWFGTGSGRYGFGLQTYNGTGNYNPYSTAPTSAHIVWTRPLRFGGLIGGEFGNSPTSNYYTGKTYEAAFTPPVIINGVLYYNVNSPPSIGFYAVDLRTGETLWLQNNTGPVITSTTNIVQGQITMGQVYRYLSPNQIGAIPYLWSTNTGMWTMYDAVTGGAILQIANATATGAATNNVVEGPNGELLMYYVGADWVAMWNSSLCIGTLGPAGTNAWQWRPPIGATLDWKRGIQWNVTVPAYPGQSIVGINSGVILASTGFQLLATPWQMEIGYDATTGQQLWAQNRTTNINDVTLGWMGPIANGVYTEYHRTTEQWFAYSLRTGTLAWGPSEADTNAWGTIVTYSDQSANGVLYGVTVDGVHAFNMTNGQKLWDFYGDNSGTDFAGFNTYPFEEWASGTTIADGIVFAVTGNSHGDALYRGARLYAINTTSGTKLWEINGFYEGTMPIADGYLVAYNGYDNQIYSFGKGQTATSVTASPKVSVHGNSVLIEGTVTDQSPGDTCLGIPAAGTPAISDDSMSAWMEYLYMQQPKPTNATGVVVSLDTLDPNGNFVHIDTVTSDESGMYKKAFVPEVPGEYTIIATFGGSNSYYSSYAETAINVDEAPQATAAPEYPQPIDNTWTIVGVGIAMIIAVAIAAIWIKRK
jgi:hypothetical protein